jgi:GNAT superfamily N-acetyltransferase
MRASEFIIEYRKNAMVGGIDLSFEYDDKFGESARVQAFSNGRKLGYAEFLIVRDNELEATDLEVDERYRGQGIARLMYDFVKQQGYKIHRSHAQTIDGHAFWNKNRGEDDRVWEDQNQAQPEVYLDMDGVLADFMAGYNRVAGTNYEPGQQLPHPSQDPTLKKITGTDFFSTLPKFRSADALVQMVVDQYGHYNICSSPLRGDHENSGANKTMWLRDNLQPQPQQIIITSRKEKYATQPDGTPNILVDDKPENIQRWNAAGGTGILYNAAVDGLDTVAAGLQLNENFADGKKPGRKGLSRRVGIPKKATLAQLQKIASSSTGERRRMAQWQLNMRRGKAKKNK